jgi:hypothetical protein
MRTDALRRPGVLIAVALIWVAITLAGSAGKFFAETQATQVLADKEVVADPAD